MTVLRRSAFLVALCALAACGGGSSSSSSTAPSSAASSASVSADQSVESAPSEASSPSEPSAADDGSASETPTVPPPTPMAIAGGNCHVEVTGDVSATWDSPGGYSAIGYGPWIHQEPDQTIAGIPMDETFFLLNCTGPGTSSINFGTSPGSKIPMQPATYTLPPADNAFGASDNPGALSVLIGLDASETNWGLREPGTLTITRFDESGIAGSFQLPVTDVLAKIAGAQQPSKGNAMITGTFDYPNPN